MATKVDIGDTIIEAIQTIVDGNIQKLAFDKTIIATIVDTSDAERGRYVVDDGSTTFFAFSDNSEYEEDTQVYVTIPNGDFTKQKLITGKYIPSNSNEPYKYTTPWNSYVDITENLVSLNPESIIANGVVLEQILGSYEIEDGENYEALGLKADFSNLLGSLNVASGDYGLKLYITTVNKETGVEQTQMVKLSTEDMVGNPYSFETYYNQQKVFDISKSNSIKYITVALYQDNKFLDILGERIPRNQIPNIFVDNIYLSLGYKSSNFDEDKVLLYTLNDITYDESYGEDGKKNQKVLKLRWVHKDGDNYTVYQNGDALGDNARIHWYQYELAPDVNDEFAGVFWKEIKSWRNTFEQKINCYEYKGLENVRFKVIVETPVKELLLRDARQDPAINETWQEYQRAYIDAENHPEDESKAEEATRLSRQWSDVAAKYTAEQNLYGSEELVLSNESSVAEAAALDLIHSLTLEVDRNGSFMLYGQNNQLVNAGDASKARTITAKYKSFLTGKEDLDKAESIAWRFPLTGTMIQPPEDGKEFNSETDDVEYSSDGQYCTITRSMTAVEGAAGDSFENAVSQTFRIKSYYQTSAANNVITCYVLKNQRLYQANADLMFGPLGNNGTDYSLVPTIADGRNCLYGTDTVPIKIKTNLYDIDEIDWSELLENNTTYSLYARDSIIKVAFCDEKGDLELSEGKPVDQITAGQECYIRRLTNDEIIKYNEDITEITDDIQVIPLFTILDVSCTFSDEELKTVFLNLYLPIPFARSRKYTRISGADRVIYNTLGTSPFYYRNAYVLYTEGDEIISFVHWHAENEAATVEELKFYPKINKDNALVPLSSYVDGINPCFAAVARDDNGKIYWSQPVVIYQEVYNSTLINGWDGSLSIDEEAGTIMSTMLGAGTKDAKNRFNGVLLGDVKGSGADSAAGMGLFGYHEGVQSFGFKNDGTAFIGKPNKGRIQFDGNKSFIQSQSYATQNAGMKLDLDDGILEMKGAVLGKVQESKASSILQSSDFDFLKEVPEDQISNYLYFVDEDGNVISPKSEIGSILYDKVRLILKLIKKEISELTDEEQLDIQKALTYISQNSSRIYSNDFFAEYNSDLDNYTIGKKRVYDEESREYKIIEGETLTSDEFKSRDYYSIYKNDVNEASAFIRLSAISPYFQIKNKAGKFLIDIRDDRYYFQSADYEKGELGAGTKFNLADGSLDSYNFNLSAHQQILYEDVLVKKKRREQAQEMQRTAESTGWNYKDSIYYKEEIIPEDLEVGGEGKQYVKLVDQNNTYGRIDDTLNIEYANYQNLNTTISYDEFFTNGELIETFSNGSIYGFNPSNIIIYEDNNKTNQFITKEEDGSLKINDNTVLRLGDLVDESNQVYSENSLITTYEVEFEDENGQTLKEEQSVKEEIPFLRINDNDKIIIYVDKEILTVYENKITLLNEKFDELYYSGQLEEYDFEKNEYKIISDVVAFMIYSNTNNKISIEARQYDKQLIYDSNIVYSELVTIKESEDNKIATFRSNGYYTQDDAYNIKVQYSDEEKNIKVKLIEPEENDTIYSIIKLKTENQKYRTEYFNVNHIFNKKITTKKDIDQDTGEEIEIQVQTEVYSHSTCEKRRVKIVDSFDKISISLTNDEFPDQIIINPAPPKTESAYRITEYKLKDIDGKYVDVEYDAIERKAIDKSKASSSGMIVISSTDENIPFQVKQDNKVSFSVAWDGTISTKKADLGALHIQDITQNSVTSSVLYIGNYTAFPLFENYATSSNSGLIIDPKNGVYYKNFFAIGRNVSGNNILDVKVNAYFSNPVKINNTLAVGGQTTLNYGLVVTGASAYVEGGFWRARATDGKWISVSGDLIRSSNNHKIIHTSQIDGMSAYAKKADVPSLTNYATKTWVQNQKYATKSWVQNQGYIGKGTGINGVRYGHANTTSGLITYAVKNGYVTSIG